MPPSFSSSEIAVFRTVGLHRTVGCSAADMPFVHYLGLRSAGGRAKGRPRPLDPTPREGSYVLFFCEAEEPSKRDCGSAGAGGRLTARRPRNFARTTYILTLTYYSICYRLYTVTRKKVRKNYESCTAVVAYEHPSKISYQM